MTILEFQRKVADALNGVEALVQGGCKALAEDAPDVLYRVQEQLVTAGGVAVVVTTPRLTRSGCGAEGIPCEAQLDVRCVEKPAANREAAGHVTALDAAVLVAKALDGAAFCFVGIDQALDARQGTLTATARLSTAIMI